MEEKLSGIVLSTTEYGENDKILNIFTLEKGIISAKIKGVKKAGAKLKFAAQPFCFAEYIFSVSLDKRTVINASLIDSFYSVREDIFKFYSAGVLTEFVKKFAKEEIVSPDTFMLLLEGLKGISYGEKDSRFYVVGFLVNALKTVGYGLKLDGCFKCGKEIDKKPYFDYLSGGFYCENCFDGEGREINFVTYQTLKDIFTKDDFTSENLVMALRLLDFYIRNRIEENIKSLNELIKL